MWRWTWLALRLFQPGTRQLDENLQDGEVGWGGWGECSAAGGGVGRVACAVVVCRDSCETKHGALVPRVVVTGRDRHGRKWDGGVGLGREQDRTEQEAEGSG